MARAYKCDLCGCLYENDKHEDVINKLHLAKEEDHRSVWADICPKCYEDFKRFINYRNNTKAIKEMEKDIIDKFLEEEE